MASDQIPHPKFQNRTERTNAGGDPPDGDKVSERIARLEAILPTLATKADIEGVRSDISRWMLATVLTVIGTSLAALIGMATLWHQPPTTPPPVAPSPVVIQVPAYVQQGATPTAPSSTAKH